MGLHFYQKQVVDDPGFRGVVEASMMLVAYEVLNEDDTTPGHSQRMSVALSLFQGYTEEVDRFVRLFSWFAVFDPQVQGEVFDSSTGTVTPQNVDDTHLDELVRAFWNTAAGYGEAAA